jgi:hypothetical protein
VGLKYPPYLQKISCPNSPIESRVKYLSTFSHLKSRHKKKKKEKKRHTRREREAEEYKYIYI